MLIENNIPIIFLHINNMFNINIEIEKVAIIYDTATFFVSTEFPHFDQFKHTNNLEVREFLSPLMRKDISYPKKVYVSRKNVSKFLEENNKKNHISRYNEKFVDDAIEDYFTQNNYVSIDFSGMPLEQQILYMYNARHVAGLMGAGTWNGIFCDNDVEYYCLRTHFWFNHEYNKDIEQVIKVKYKVIDIINQFSYESVFNELSEKMFEH
jgi:capsular polysaccharide biosynthesis protein